MSGDQLVSFTKVTEFDREEENFPLWKMKFEAIATLNEFCEALQPIFRNEMPDKCDEVLQDTDDGEKKKKDAPKKNNLAMSYFTMAFTGDELLCMLEEVKTPRFPGGIAWQLLLDLMDKYQPNDTIGAVHQLNELMALKLKKGENPKKLGERIAKIMNKYRSKVDKSQKVIVVVNCSGKKYVNVILQETA